MNARFWEWGVRIVMVLGIGVTIGMVRAAYVTREDFSVSLSQISQKVERVADNLGNRFETANASAMGRLGSVETALAVIAEQNKANSRQDDLLRDLEMRVRATERELANQDRLGIR